MDIKPTDSWIMKAILNQRSEVQRLNGWENIMGWHNFNMSKVYRKLQDYGVKVDWKNLVYGNNARPRACFMLWLTCHEKLATKDRLHKFGMIDNRDCCFCAEEESINHLFFECNTMKRIWMNVLNWLQVRRTPHNWHIERQWLTQQAKGKGPRAQMIKMAAAETIYELWMMRNNKSFGNDVDTTSIVKNIIDTVIYRGWENKKIRRYLAILMIGE
ncbi:uncharacterized protein LOC131645486 [Vicia villosa]|uniref:uncharacterized protein LOC131645486 n=1 Tax=Vicia villosa TaxID=3911 RepID=UPI00273C60B5|nr:uncharacterized protein LOC131645486 [Vicia villosa]